MIGKYASQIKEASKRGDKIELFTTLEPCLMCFGTIVHNRINRIVYACPDPLAGPTSIEPPTKWYGKKMASPKKSISQSIKARKGRSGSSSAKGRSKKNFLTISTNSLSSL